MTEPKAGTLLIAEPFLKDPNFMRTVVFLCDHQREGSFGFVLNRLYHHTLDELMQGILELTIPVYYGGPVQMDSIHFLHQCPEKIFGGIEVLNGIYWGGDFETAITLLQTGEISNNDIRFFIGYSGWGDGQLEEELQQKSWLTARAVRRIVFHKNNDDLWKDALDLLGSEFEPVKNYPIDPQLN